MENDFVWIKTRDGFPTLWNQNLGESYRSIKGAFLESWHVFVKPALKLQKDLKITQPKIGEFGLGAGTNWILWSTAQKLLGFEKLDYSCVENNLKSFEIGLKKWTELEDEIVKFLTTQLLAENLIKENSGAVGKFFENLKTAKVYNSLNELILSFDKFDFWFHDPFGFDVNPEGYSEETLRKCSQVFKPSCRGFSYACNSKFQKNLKSSGFNFEILQSDPVGKLKRERIEFFLETKT